MKRILFSWIPFAVVLTAVALMVYAAVQQVYRSSANDPQIQMAEDTAARLAAGASPETVVAGEPVDMARSKGRHRVSSKAGPGSEELRDLRILRHWVGSRARL